MKQCPSCGVAMVRLRVSRKPPKGTPWYRYSRTRRHCPACGIELRAHTRALGYALQIVMVVLAGGEAVIVNASGADKPLRAVAIGLFLACILIIAAICGRYGFRYSAVPSSDSKDNNSRVSP